MADVAVTVPPVANRRRAGRAPAREKKRPVRLRGARVGVRRVGSFGAMEPVTARTCPVRVAKSTARLSTRVSPSTPRQQRAPLNIIIPMGGLGSNEFTESGYTQPKPMVPIVGRPMLFWLLDNLELRDDDSVWFGTRRDVEATCT